MNECIQIKEIHTRKFNKQEYSWAVTCERCGHNFDNEMRYEWRLRPDRSGKYLSGMFWTVHCHGCLLIMKDKWREALNEIV